MARILSVCRCTVNPVKSQYVGSINENRVEPKKEITTAFEFHRPLLVPIFSYLAEYSTCTILPVLRRKPRR